MKRIIIINQPSSNRGDEAAHRSLVRKINASLPEAKVEVIYTQESENTVKQMTVQGESNSYSIIRLNIRGMNGFFPKLIVKYDLFSFVKIYTGYRKIFNKIKNADIVICAPGGICMGGFHNWNHLFFLGLAFYAKKEIIYYSRSIGPFSSICKEFKIFNRRSLDLLRKMSFISLRDKKSMVIAQDLGIEFIPSIDTAFLDVPEAKISSELKLEIGNNYIIFVPNSLTWHPAFKSARQDIIDNFYLKVIDYLLDKFPTSNIVMLPQLFNAENSDYQYFNKLKNANKNNRIVVVNEEFGSDIQQKIISDAKFVIGARYHSIVFSINNEIPFVALNYEHKIAGLLEVLGLTRVKVDITNLGTKFCDEAYLLNQINDVICNAISIDELKTAHSEAYKIACDCYNKMLTFIK